MKRQRLSLAAVATFAFLASWAVPCVCVAQTWDYSEAHGKEICDPLPPESYAVFADGSVEKIVDGANLSLRVVASLMICNTRVENVDFSGSTILRGSFDQAVLVRCNFAGAFLRGGFCDNYTKFVDCVFDDALLDGFNCDALSAKQLKKTRNFKRPSSLAEAKSGKFPPERLYMRLNDVRCANLDFSFAHLRGSYLDLTARQLRQTLDFHHKSTASCASSPPALPFSITATSIFRARPSSNVNLSTSTLPAPTLPTPRSTNVRSRAAV